MTRATRPGEPPPLAGTVGATERAHLARYSVYGAADVLPLPACGERVGVRGPFDDSERKYLPLKLAERPPHPDRCAIRPLPACGERYDRAAQRCVHLVGVGQRSDAVEPDAAHRRHLRHSRIASSASRGGVARLPRDHSCRRCRPPGDTRRIAPHRAGVRRARQCRHGPVGETIAGSRDRAGRGLSPLRASRLSTRSTSIRRRPAFARSSPGIPTSPRSRPRTASSISIPAAPVRGDSPCRYRWGA